MQHHGYSSGTIAEYILGLHPIEIGRSNNRSVLGSMNDYVFHLKFLIERSGGLVYSDLGATTQSLNQIPQVKRSFFNAAEAFDQSITERVA